MSVKLFDSELKVMNVIWAKGAVTASEVSKILADEVGWTANTTYTLIKRCIQKGAVERTNPGFVCRPLVSKEEVQADETNELINKIYDGSADKLFAALVGRTNLTPEQIEKLKQMARELE